MNEKTEWNEPGIGVCRIWHDGIDWQWCTPFDTGCANSLESAMREINECIDSYKNPIAQI